MNNRMPIPKYYSFPWGWEIWIKYDTRANLGLELKESNQKPEDGYWDIDKMTIWIVSDNITLAQQRYVFGHELVHAAHDWLDRHLDSWTISERQIPRRPRKSKLTKPVIICPETDKTSFDPV